MTPFFLRPRPFVVALAVLGGVWAASPAAGDPIPYPGWNGPPPDTTEKLELSDAAGPLRRALTVGAAALERHWAQAFPALFPDAQHAYVSPWISLYDPALDSDEIDYEAYYAPLGDYVGPEDDHEISVNIYSAQRIAIIVLAHEYAHHIQWLTTEFERPRARSADAADSMDELQAECFTGAWAAEEEAKPDGLVSPGDIEAYDMATDGPETQDAMAAAWFRKGLAEGMGACLTPFEQMAEPTFPAR